MSGSSTEILGDPGIEKCEVCIGKHPAPGSLNDVLGKRMLEPVGMCGDSFHFPERIQPFGNAAGTRLFQVKRKRLIVPYGIIMNLVTGKVVQLPLKACNERSGFLLAKFSAGNALPRRSSQEAAALSGKGSRRCGARTPSGERRKRPVFPEAFCSSDR